jgi:sulfate transporter 4
MVSLLVEAGLRGKLTEQECPEWYEESAQSAGVEQYEVCPEAYVNLAILTAACVGAMQIISRFLKLGFLVSFLGHPVISGFTSGAAIIIGLSQVKYVLGFSVAKSEFVHVTLANLWDGIAKGNTKPMTLFLGLTWIVCLFLNKKMAQRVKKLSRLGPLGPLIACAAGMLLIWLFEPLRTKYDVKYVGDIPSGIFPVSIQVFTPPSSDDIFKVLPTAISATIIGYMESIAIGKSLATKHGYELEAGQELFALGMSNIVGAMFSCYPVTGSFSRSAVNNATGARSQFSGLVTALGMLCTLLFLTPLFYYLPKFVLAAIVINSVMSLVAIDEARNLWRVRKHDFMLWVVAFLGTLFLGVLVGIGIAVLLSLLIVIYESVRPQIAVLWRIPGTTIYRNVKQETSGTFIPNVFIARIGSSLYFANASFVKDTLQTYVDSFEDVNKTEYLILEMTPVVSIDASAAHVIHDIVSGFRARGIQIAFAMVGNRVDKTMRRAKLKAYIGEQWFFPSVNEAVRYCLQHQRAKKLTESDHEALEVDVPPGRVSLGDEIGVSNDLHHAYTAVCVNLAKDIPTGMSEISAVFQKNSIAVARAQVEPLGDGGAKHAYLVWNIAKAQNEANGSQKLTDSEIVFLRSEIEVVISRHRGEVIEI